MLSLHEHNEASRTAALVEEIAGGKSIALVTDAGMPGVSDPGFRLIRACRERGLGVGVLPGPSAVITALVGSGLPTNAFYFGGFVPVKSGRRRSELERAVSRPRRACILSLRIASKTLQFWRRLPPRQTSVSPGS